MNLEPENGEGGPNRPGATGPAPFDRIFLGPVGLRAGWRAALYAALYLLFLIVLQLVVAGLFHYRPGPQPGEITAGQLFPGELGSIVCAVCAALVMGAMEGRRFGDYGMPLGEAFRARFWQGALWGIAEMSALMLLIRAFGGYSFGGWALSGGDAARYALIWGAVFLLVGVNEEFLFRGYLQFTLASGMGFWPAATLLSLAFGAAHLRNPGEVPIGALGVFAIGMFFCLTLRRTGDLWFAIGLHAAYDFGETYLYSVPDSGATMRGHLLASDLHGPAWLTGGTVGPEGSALAFVVLGAMFLLFDRMYRPLGNRAQHTKEHPSV